MKTKKFDANVFMSGSEKDLRLRLTEMLKTNTIPDEELLENLGLFLTSKNFSRLLFFHEIYKKIIDKHGIIIEFGIRWGQTLSIVAALRGIFEPFNRHRKIIGFDTFTGLKGIDYTVDGKKNNNRDGSYSLPVKYEEFLTEILSIQEALNPVSHIKKFEIIKGDAQIMVPKYFKDHPETIVSLAIFDFDIYKPTKVALHAIKPLLAKGSILVFDELCDEIFPGETLALQEEFGLNNIHLKRIPFTSRLSYFEIE